MLDRFMTPRPLLCRGVMSDTIFSELGDKSTEARKGGPAKDLNSKSQPKKREKMLRMEQRKLQKAAE